MENIDTLREDILSRDGYGTHFNIYSGDGDEEDYILAPYDENFRKPVINGIQQDKNGMWWPMNGLGLRTYLSDRFNNWLKTDWIDGENGIDELTKITPEILSGEGLKYNTLILMERLYNFLNRVVVMNGSYRAWQIAGWAHGARTEHETPEFCGGKAAEIVFNEVVSTAEAGNEPLGSLGGRGQITGERGGKIHIKAYEPSYVMGIVSIVPRIDYSQGNEWYTRLYTWDDYHKPEFDGISFQELITDEMAAWDTIR